MTGEHKILTLIDRGVRDEATITRCADVESADIRVHMSPPATIEAHASGALRLTSLGVARLDMLDDVQIDNALAAIEERDQLRVRVEWMESRLEELETEKNYGPPLELGGSVLAIAKSNDEIIDEHYQRIADCRTFHGEAAIGGGILRCHDCGWRAT